MQLYFLESGIDSLRKGFENLIKYEELFIKEKSVKTRFFHLKDAILFIQHGTEILLKQILVTHSEYLIFSQIDENVKNAFKEKNTKQLESVFESSLNHKIHTVNFIEAIERVKIIPNISLDKNLERRLKELERYRNIIMHSEAHLNEIEINQTFDGLSDELDMFFYKTIGDKYNTISGYSILLENFKLIKLLLSKKNLEIKSNVIEVFLNSFNASGISIGMNEVKRITNIDKVTNFFKILFDSKLFFGTDLYNLECSGDVKFIKRKNETTFSMYTSDNDTYYDFKFKSLIIYIPELVTNLSPILFIEADEDTIVENDHLRMREYDTVKYYEFLVEKSTSKLIENSEEITDIKNDEYYEYEDFEHHIHFLTKGLCCFINVQKLDYSREFREYIYGYKFIDGKEFEVHFRQALKK